MIGFRSDATPAGVSGPQAVIEPSLPAADAMGLYETNGRGWVRKWGYPPKAGLYKAGDWNDLAVTAIGTRIPARLGAR